ncbi:uncharacterized protein L969DRAFT_83963 [Mixia osmundae IAM 14324]|uniref:P-loop containing nucleoside triphosphate hydrolase protein n=1 Tax=Mixia osmundae (strain CBS 9802 / IAM 14324 / JCM 22182 / KY 12970) TaxID=764103 RepID=G7DV71_MIXOS|nr:uncharacterized protein L969DRAFT_83963 [Mixia osmundae IAM 14324]KEI42095.1 hypothetical protein L969DRAFT_83963 [Mixia osmundae IAM 14324]GAA94481.1 hypothetical protein E5Q_01133 [Mixia osmundae IAM 14324]
MQALVLLGRAATLLPLLFLAASAPTLFIQRGKALRRQKGARQSDNQSDERTPLLSDRTLRRQQVSEHELRQRSQSGASQHSRRRRRASLTQALPWLRLVFNIVLFALVLAAWVVGARTRPIDLWTMLHCIDILACTVYTALLAAVALSIRAPTQLLYKHCDIASAVILISSVSQHITPYLAAQTQIVDGPLARLGLAEASIALASCIIALITPQHYVPVLPDVMPHPRQTASRLSCVLFSFLDKRMIRYYLYPPHEAPPDTTLSSFKQKLDNLTDQLGITQHDSPNDHLDVPNKELPDNVSEISDVASEASSQTEYKGADLPADERPWNARLSFSELLPPLPDILHSRWVLSKMRWLGDNEDDSDDDLRVENRPEGSMRVFLTVFRAEALQITFTALLWIVFIFVSPLSMNLLLDHVQRGGSASLVSPYVFALGLFVGPIGASVAFQQCLFMIAQMGLRLRALLSHAILTKVLRMRSGGSAASDNKTDDGSEAEATASGDTTGRVNNLVGTDIDVITASLETSLQLLAVPFKIVVSLVYLYFLLGWSAFVALAAIIAFVPLSTWVSSRYGAVQGSIMKATDRRINLINESLNAIRTIKYFAWEDPMQKGIYAARERELARIIRRARVFFMLMVISTGVPAIVTLATFAAFVYAAHGQLTASIAFTSLSLFSLLREAVISSTYLTSAFLRARVSLGRIADFIRDEEEISSSSRKRAGDRISCDHASFHWSRDSGSFELCIDRLECPPGQLTLVAGPTGSGKSALVAALLGEMDLVKGEAWVPAGSTISYAAQEPFLLDDTIRENILFGNEYDRKRYKRALFECSLISEIAGFERKDKTNALALSGGQKSRVCLCRAVYACSDIVLLDDVLSAVDSRTASHIVQKCLDGKLLKGRTVILVTHYLELCAQAVACAHIVKMKSGRITSQGPAHEMVEDDTAQKDDATDGGGELDAEHGDNAAEVHDVETERSSSAISWTNYRSYFSAMGGIVFWTLYALINLAAHVLMLGSGAWVGVWTNSKDKVDRASYYFGIYAGIQVASGISLTIMYLYLIVGAVRASRTLHRDLVTSIFGAPVHVFDRIPLGRFMNRLSKDIEIIDTEVVESLQPVFDYGVQVTLVAVTIAAVLPAFLVPAAIIAIAFFFVGQLYIRNALATRKRVAVSRSPLFNTLGNAVRGVMTIRAFGRQQDFVSAFREANDDYNRAQFHEQLLDRWLEERSDAVGATVALIVGLLTLTGSVSPGITGFLVSTGLEFTTRILYVVKAINRNELNVNSVARVLEYSSQLDQEPQGSEECKPPASWPDQGAVEIQGLSVKYDEDGPDVLRNVSIKVEQRAKIGIVGRSGSGKTTLSLALLRCVHRSAGRILIDGRDISDINLKDLRQRVTLISQEPVLFSGTIRSNLNPLNDEMDDADLWQGLKASGFLESGGTAHYTLDTPVTSHGGNFSLGQKQLLALARSLVRSTRVVIFDESTANVDADTDAFIQDTIRKHFRDSTCITIAHRLDSILDCDKVLVMKEGGTVAEWESPLKLLQDKNSIFHDMCAATGSVDDMLHRAQQGARSRKDTM